MTSSTPVRFFCTRCGATREFSDEVVASLQNVIAHSIKSQLDPLHKQVAELSAMVASWRRDLQEAEAEEKRSRSEVESHIAARECKESRRLAHTLSTGSKGDIRQVTSTDTEQVQNSDLLERPKSKVNVNVGSNFPPKELDQLERERANELFEAEREFRASGDDAACTKIPSKDSSKQFAKHFRLLSSSGSTEGSAPQAPDRLNEFSSLVPSGANRSDGGPYNRIALQVDAGQFQYPGDMHRIYESVDVPGVMETDADKSMPCPCSNKMATLDDEASDDVAPLPGNRAREDVLPLDMSTTRLETLQRSRALELCRAEIEGGDYSAEHQYETCVFLLQRSCGVLPWLRQTNADQERPSFWVAVARGYQFAMVALASCAVAWGVSAWLRASPPPRSDLAMSLGSLLGLLCSGAGSRSSEIGEFFRILTSTAHRQGFHGLWVRATCKDIVLTIALWLSVILARCATILGHGFVQEQARGWNLVIDLVSFSFGTAILAGISSCILHMNRGLALLVDSFCTECQSRSTEWGEAVAKWNVTQAKLRSGCRSLQSCFIALQASIFAAGVLTAVDAVDDAWAGKASSALGLAPVMLLLSGLAGVLTAAAKTTDKCIRAPSFINACNHGTDIDLERSYLVEYMVRSRAGFYIIDVRVTSYMVSRLGFSIFSIGLALGTRAFRQ